MKDTEINDVEAENCRSKPSRLVEIFLLAAAGMATTVVVQPWDVIKVRMQLSEQNYYSWYKAEQIYKYEGVRGLYSGLTAGFFRTCSATTIRLSLHGYLLDRHKTTYKRPPYTKEHILITTMSSATAALVTNPAEVAVVRMMADGYHRICHRNWPRRYKNVLDAFYKIFKAEGVHGLFRGAYLTIARSVLISTMQAANYYRFNQYFKNSDLVKGFMIYVYSAMMSSLITCVFSSPLDFLKTQYQASSQRIRIRDIAIHAVNKHGYVFFWSGFTPYFVRCTVYTVLIYYLLDYEYHIYNQRIVGRLCLTEEKLMETEGNETENSDNERQLRKTSKM